MVRLEENLALAVFWGDADLKSALPDCFASLARSQDPINRLFSVGHP